MVQIEEAADEAHDHQLVAEAPEGEVVEDTVPAASREELLELAGDLAKDPDILERVGKDAARAGFAGDTTLVELVVLALTTRVADEPTSVILTGASSAGKSFAVRTALRFVPPEAYIMLTSASEKSLYYTQDDFCHKFVIFNELGGVVGDALVEAVKSLLSEGELRYQVTRADENSPNGFSVAHVHKEGPSGLISTVVDGIDAELWTRAITPAIDDSPEQTRKVLVMHASGASPALVNFEPYVALQRLVALETKPTVVIPFADQLAEKVDVHAVRMRRDYMHLLSLIKGCVVLHQENRHRDDDGSLIADIDDYRIVHRLAAAVIEETAGASVPPSIAETVELLEAAKMKLAVAKVAELLGVDRSTATRRLNKAHELGFARFDQEHRGAPKFWGLATPLDEAKPVLPDPDDLAV